MGIYIREDFQTIERIPGVYGHFFRSALSKIERLQPAANMWPAHTATKDNRDFCLRSLARVNEIIQIFDEDVSVEAKLKERALLEMEEFRRIFKQLSNVLEEYGYKG